MSWNSLCVVLFLHSVCLILCLYHTVCNLDLIKSHFTKFMLRCFAVIVFLFEAAVGVGYSTPSAPVSVFPSCCCEGSSILSFSPPNCPCIHFCFALRSWLRGLKRKTVCVCALGVICWEMVDGRSAPEGMRGAHLEVVSVRMSFVFGVCAFSLVIDLVQGKKYPDYLVICMTLSGKQGIWNISQFFAEMLTE